MKLLIHDYQQSRWTDLMATQVMFETLHGVKDNN